jgi:xylose isomerase
MCLWPGEDGWDYHFQADYRQLWDWTAEALREIAEYDPETQIGYEYKLKEPRTHSLVGNAAKAALLGYELGLPNVGVYLDFGHALMSRENPAESVALLVRHKRLVGVHVNDNYGAGDDDVIVGSVHFWAMLEFLFALQQVEYDGWLTLDIVPTRESPVAACAQSIVTLRNFLRLLSRLDRDGLAHAQAEMNSIASQRIVQALLGAE